LRVGYRHRWEALARVEGETPALVAIVPRVKDWRLLLDRHWYRIPVRTAPDDLPDCRYIAFYQPGAFGAEKWSVNWYARVRGLAAAARSELLPDEAGHPRAADAYWRVELDGLLRLPRPIPSRRLRRVVFFPTTLERLLVADEINDLFRTTPIEDRLYYALRDTGLAPERRFFAREAGGVRELDLAFLCRDGGLDVECDGTRYHSGRERAEADRRRDNALTVAGWRILRFSGGEINRNLPDCVRTVRRAVRRLGGAAAVGRPGGAGPGTGAAPRPGPGPAP
jgi:very-short-patch-repair endonuclease